MKNHFTLLCVFCTCLFFHNSYSQVTNPKVTYGIWQNCGGIINKFDYPELNGRIFNYKWKDLEITDNVWDWASFDNYIKDRVSDSTPIILMIFTKGNAPDWLYQKGVPKVTEMDSKGNAISYCPYFADPTYKSYFKRMIDTVYKHIENLPLATRVWITGIQGCFGEEGDYIGYKGSVASKYQLSTNQLADLFKEFTLYYYNNYKNANPKITLMSNPANNGKDQIYWLLANCPGVWLKPTHLGKEYQANYEMDKAAWLLDVLNKKQSGEYVRGRSELSADNLSQGWWKTNTPRNMFSLMSYMVYWGMDWSNQLPEMVKNPLYTDAFDFFNKYTGQKDTVESTNAMCALRDGLDASDVTRFPEAVYGTAVITNKTRFQNIQNQFAAYGAKLGDIAAATGTEIDNLVAKGINDVGWRIFPGNYERYLHQIDANSTSIGYWNIDASADTSSMYGRFGRSISKANGKDALYFNVDDAFFNDTAIRGKYPVSIDIIYLDKGTGSFELRYHAKGDHDKLATQVTCTNSNTWKKIAVTLTDANMNNKAEHNSDFYIKSTSDENVIFDLVELSKPANATSGAILKQPSGAILTATSPAAFDTICYTSTSGPHSFVLSGNFLNSSDVTVGPVAGFRFSENTDSSYTDSITFHNYGSSLQKTIYVMFTPNAGGDFNIIPVKGGGARSIKVSVSATALNSSPILSANINNISCNNSKNGSIDLILTDGTGPFTYQWSCSAKPFKLTTSYIDSLTPADYSVLVTSKAGCTTNATYTISEPEVLDAIVTQDSAITCKGGNTTVTVSATGGTAPFQGVGSFSANSGYSTYKVTDNHGCTSTANISIDNGTLIPPVKPTSIVGDEADKNGLCGNGDFTYTAGSVTNATSYVWTLPANCTINTSSADSKTVALNVSSQFNDGLLGVSAVNVCGASGVFTKYITHTPQQPDAIVGQTIVSKLKAGLSYKVQSPVAGLQYYWTVPNGVTITSGQNTSNVTVTWGSSAGKIKVEARNNCGSSQVANLDININTAFNQDALVNGSDNVQLKTLAGLQLLPNPTTSFAYCTIKGNGTYSIKLFDVSGKTLWQKNSISISGEYTEKIDVHNFSGGLYLVHITDDKGFQKTMRLLKD